MMVMIIFLILLPLIYGKLSPLKTCENCLGKIHTRKDLELVKQPLIINQNEICRNEKYPFMIIIKSNDFQRRNFTRSTWAKEILEHFNIPVLYALSYPSNTSFQKEILSENQIYKDLLQFHILESYYNLTLKTISVLLWYKQYCSNSSHYLLYVDDDILIHVDKLIMYMNSIDNDQNTIEGWFERSGKIQRTGIGGVSKEDFSIDFVPDYLWGAAVLYPSRIISDVLIPSIFNTTLPIFFRDDVFINGFIAEQARIHRRSMKGVLLYDQTEDDLKTHMIIINFPNEKHRIQAWNCYRLNLQCNKNLLKLFLKIFSGVTLMIMMIIFCWKYLRTTSCYYQFKYECNLWYYGMNDPYKRRMDSNVMIERKQRFTVGTKLGMQWLKRMGIRIGFLCFIIISLVYLVQNI